MGLWNSCNKRKWKRKHIHLEKEGIYLVDKVCKKISTGYPLNSITKYTKNNKYLCRNN